MFLLHGGGRDRQDWDPCARELARRFHVVAPDLPGHASRRDVLFDIDSAIDDIDRLAGELGSSDPIVVGHSIGGIVATAHAARRLGEAPVVNVDEVGVSIPASLRRDRDAYGAVVSLIDKMRGLVPNRDPKRQSHTSWPTSTCSI